MLTDTQSSSLSIELEACGVKRENDRESSSVESPSKKVKTVDSTDSILTEGFSALRLSLNTVKFSENSAFTIWSTKSSQTQRLPHNVTISSKSTFIARDEDTQKQLTSAQI